MNPSFLVLSSSASSPSVDSADLARVEASRRDDGESQLRAIGGMCELCLALVLA